MRSTIQDLALTGYHPDAYLFTYFGTPVADLIIHHDLGRSPDSSSRSLRHLLKKWWSKSFDFPWMSRIILRYCFILIINNAIPTCALCLPYSVVINLKMISRVSIALARSRNGYVYNPLIVKITTQTDTYLLFHLGMLPFARSPSFVHTESLNKNSWHRSVPENDHASSYPWTENFGINLWRR